MIQVEFPKKLRDLLDESQWEREADLANYREVLPRREPAQKHIWNTQRLWWSISHELSIIFRRVQDLGFHPRVWQFSHISWWRVNTYDRSWRQWQSQAWLCGYQGKPWRLQLRCASHASQWKFVPNLEKNLGARKSSRHRQWAAGSRGYQMESLLIWRTQRINFWGWSLYGPKSGKTNQALAPGLIVEPYWTRFRGAWMGDAYS